MVEVQLFVFTRDAAELEQLKLSSHAGELSSHAGELSSQAGELSSQASAPIVFFRGGGAAATGACKLDALWVTPMQANYLGVDANPPRYHGVVVETPEEQRKKGLTPFLVVGVDITPGERLPVLETAELCTSVLVKTAAEFRTTEAAVLSRIGSISANVGLRAENAEEVKPLIPGILQAQQNSPRQHDNLVSQVA